MLTEAIEKQENLIELEKQKKELLEKLHKATLIKSVIPNAFDHGACTIESSKLMKPYPSREYYCSSIRLVLGNGDIIKLTDEQRDKFLELGIVKQPN